MSQNQLNFNQSKQYQQHNENQLGFQNVHEQGQMDLSTHNHQENYHLSDLNGIDEKILLENEEYKSDKDQSLINENKIHQITQQNEGQLIHNMSQNYNNDTTIAEQAKEKQILQNQHQQYADPCQQQPIQLQKIKQIPNIQNSVLLTNKTLTQQEYIAQNVTQTLESLTQNVQSTPYNSYLQSVLNTKLNPAAQPTNQALQEIYHQLKIQFPQCLPEQIILLLYNNLIKHPRQQMIQQEGQNFDETMKYDGGEKYWAQLNSTNNKYDLSSFEIRKQMIKVYVTKGYGLKVFQQHMLSLNPQSLQIDKQKFKKHFIQIYKITMKKVEEFLTNKADRQFQPLRKDEYQKPLSDVINCRKHYSPQFCQVFYRILQATFDMNYENVPTQKEVAFFYRTILEKIRGTSVNIVRKLHQPQQEKDTDIWTQQFEFFFIKLFIVTKKLLDAKIKLIQRHPQFQSMITDEKLRLKIQNAIRMATRQLQIQNQNCGNTIVFAPTDIDRRFIMRAPELEQSRIKLLKFYVKKPNDPQVITNIVNFIHKQLEVKYEKERISAQVLQKSSMRQVPRSEQQAGLERLLKNQIMKTA